MLRIHLILGVVIFLLLPAGVHGQEQVIELRIAQSHPAFASRLAPGEPLYVRLTYKSGKPAAFWIRAYAEGKEITDSAAYNVRPRYPAGEREALVWLSFREPTKIDEIRVFAAIDGWKPAATISTGVALAWGEGETPRPRPAWVERLNSEQQDMVRRRIDEDAGSAEDDWLGEVIINLGWISVLGYLVLQVWLLSHWSGGWRVAALVPLVATVPLFGYTLFALGAGSNLWPLALLLLMPFAFLYLLALAGVRWVAGVARA